MKTQQKNTKQQVKSFFLVIIFAVSILVLSVSMINVSKQNIAGKAFYRPVQIYGEVYPDLPDGTEISFKVGRIVVALATIEDNKYGDEPKIYFKMDDPLTPKVEGYSKGDIVKVHIEGVEIMEFSYFEPWATQKIINIPASKRAEVSERAAKADIERRCMPNWVCDVWSDCIEGLQGRICRDIAECGTDKDMPAVTRSCTMAPEVEQPIQPEETDVSIKIVIFAIMILILAGYFALQQRMPKRKKAKKKR
ncbi:hypothetical protein GOV06_04790 [Candidatus Woesearchaeota archaeon]|nr:hypothetical protein [Candidatus Woesearchaeota archaeon]